MIAKTTRDARLAGEGGVVSGLAAGIFLTAMMTVMSYARGNDIWLGIKGAAAPILGGRAELPGFDFWAVWLGFAIHLAVSIGWAVAFTLLFYALPKGKTIAAGAAWGLVVWLGMYYVVLPLVGLRHMVEQAPVLRSIVYHVFFGLAVSLAYVSYRKKPREVLTLRSAEAT